MQVALALFAFPRAAGKAGLGGALALGLLGAPPAVLADRLSGASAVSLGSALAPLALLATATFFRAPRRRDETTGPWCLLWAAIGFGLPWLESLARDFGREPIARLGALSPLLGSASPLAPAAVLAAAAVAGAARRRA